MHLQRRRRIGGILWGAGLVLAFGWGALDTSGAEGVGYGFAPPVNVAALETARVLEIPVHLHDAVSADQIVVRMDSEPLVEERQVAAAMLLAVQEEQILSTVSEARKFAAGVEGTSFNQAKLSSDVQEDAALLATLRERLSLEEDLAQTGASSNQAVEEWRRQMRVVEARLNANRYALSIASDAASGALARSESLPDAGQWSVVAATRTLELVEGRIRRMELSAGLEGQVTWIYRGPGDVVPAGEPILQVRQTGTREVVAFLTPADAKGLVAGESAAVRRATGQVVSGTLLSVGSGPQPLPPQLWKMPSWPEYGVPVRVELETEIAPDESVTVRL